MQRRNYFAQVDRKRLALSDDIDALFFDSGLKYIKCGVAVDNLASEFCISLRASVKCLCDLLLKSDPASGRMSAESKDAMKI